MITPIKKPQGGELHESDHDYNSEVNRLRAVVERAIAHLKTWRILHTDHRRPSRQPSPPQSDCISTDSEWEERFVGSFRTRDRMTAEEFSRRLAVDGSSVSELPSEKWIGWFVERGSAGAGGYFVGR